MHIVKPHYSLGAEAASSVYGLRSASLCHHECRQTSRQRWSRVLNLRERVRVDDFECEYRVHFFAVKRYTLKSVAGICCINWNYFSEVVYLNVYYHFEHWF